MIRFIYGDELNNSPRLRDGMFRDRKIQFRDRLNWDVKVDADGHERDEYDAMNPLYVIWQRSDGRHGGSMRFLPTTGNCMVNDHFTHLTDGVRIESPFIWECTRFCLAPDAPSDVSGALMLAGAELGAGFHLDHSVGIFDKRMIRIYRLLGWSPTIVGTGDDNGQPISVGLWEFSEEIRQRLAKRCGISADLSRLWFEQAFGGAAPMADVG